MSVVLLHPLVSLLGADAALARDEVFRRRDAGLRSGACRGVLPGTARAGRGAARQVMIGLIASTVRNLAFDVLFILVLHYGIAGAGLSMGLPTSASSSTSSSGWPGTANT